MMQKTDQKHIMQLLTVFGCGLFILMGLTIMATSFGVYLDPSRAPLGFLFLATLLSLSAWVIRDVARKSLLQSASFKYLFHLTTLTLVVFIAGKYIPDSQSYNVSIEESTEAAVIEHPLGVINWSSQEQQAPSDYYMMFSSLNTIGKNMWGLRSKNLIVTFILLALIMAFIHFITRNWMFAIILTMLAASNPVFHRHTWHARTLTLGLAHYALFLILMFALIAVPLKKWPLSLITTIFFLLLASCGLQPMIALFCGVVIFYFWSGTNHIERPKILKAFVIASVLFVPYLILMSILSHEANQFHNSTQVFFNDLKSIGAWRTWRSFVMDAFPLGAFIWAAAGILIIFKHRDFRQSPLFVFSLLNLIAFPLVFIIIFKVFIDYTMNTRYHILHLLNTLFFITIAIGPISFIRAKERFVSLFILGAATCMLLMSMYVNEGWKSWRFTPAFQQDFDLNSAYESIHEYTTSKDYVYVIRLEVPGYPIKRRFTAPQLYAANQKPTTPKFRPWTLKPYQMSFPELWTNDNFLVQDVLSDIKAQRLVFIHYTPNPAEDTSTHSPVKLPAGVVVHRLQNFDLYVVAVNGDVARSALPFYMAFIESGNGHPNIVPLLETALFLAILSKDENAFAKLYSSYSRFLDTDFRTGEYSKYYIRYHDCRFLARVFKERAQKLGWKVPG